MELVELQNTGECQNPYNHNPYCVEILIGFVEILIGLLEILIGLLEILIGQFRDFNCRDYDCRDFDCRDFDIDRQIVKYILKVKLNKIFTEIFCLK